MTPELEQKINDMHLCLVGDKLKGTKGLVDRVENCEDTISEIKDDVREMDKKKANKIGFWNLFKFVKIFKTGI